MLAARMRALGNCPDSQARPCGGAFSGWADVLVTSRAFAVRPGTVVVMLLDPVLPSAGGRRLPGAAGPGPTGGARRPGRGPARNRRPMTDARTGWRAVGGVLGPVVFVAAWCTLGTRRADYSAIDDPISRLAAVDASTRWAMTAGFATYGAGVFLYATELAAAGAGKAAAAARTTAVATIGIALTPLGSSLGGTAHATAAGVAYTALAMTPLLAAKPLAAQARPAAAWASAVVGLASGAALLASVVTSNGTGLFQRIGLSIGDAWILASAGVLLRRR